MKIRLAKKLINETKNSRMKKMDDFFLQADEENY